MTALDCLLSSLLGERVLMLGLPACVTEHATAALLLHYSAAKLPDSSVL